ncbi:F0F1 ATP synthase subunit A [Schleiferia thermophila]|jgi:F-type H+-transporting ATPase subunit a|uniref:F0F1 ATP synthase subunit A n=1 Tax=Schleiferia thermophila TaxID=884107 RepID=UPI0004E71412|nr:F0F1 ATP synthase subunit A [Schleiferia thermophila]KFD39729.1 ATP synthase F0 subunit A [Schleiferia thermophila str. Yellowstone]
MKIARKPGKLLILFSLLLAAPFTVRSFYSSANSLDTTDPHITQNTEEQEENINDLIMHHIADAHDFHILDWKDHSISIPLPVILYTKEGLVTFMSNAFHHDDHGRVVVEKGSQRFVKYHEKIYYASEKADSHGSFVNKGDDGAILNDKPIDISITKNVFSLFLTAFLVVFIAFKSASNYKTNSRAPKGFASFIEPILVFIRDEIALQNIGEKYYERFVPYLITLFFFIWIANMLGLMPVFPGGANLSGNIAFTMSLALLTLILMIFNASGDFWKHTFWMPGVPVPMKLLLAPIELIGIFTKPFALMIRLFANMTAGHIVILSLIGLIFIFKSVAVAPASILLTLFIYLIKVFISLLQAYIFTLLSALFIGQTMATHEHDDHH